jgi:hypothetical protein
VTLGRTSTRARALALLPLAAFGVHQLRYRLAFGGEADHELIAQGHQYLGSLTPALAFVAALACAELLARLAQAWHGKDASASTAPLAPLAAIAALSLVAIYAGQELLEGVLATGHPTGLVGVFGDGGLWALPLAGLFGAVIALVLRGADRAVVLLARVRWAGCRRAATAPRSPAPRTVFLPARSPLASAAPGRAPPLAATSH